MSRKLNKWTFRSCLLHGCTILFKIKNSKTLQITLFVCLKAWSCLRQVSITVFSLYFLLSRRTICDAGGAGAAWRCVWRKHALRSHRLSDRSQYLQWKVPNRARVGYHHLSERILVSRQCSLQQYSTPFFSLSELQNPIHYQNFTQTLEKAQDKAAHQSNPHVRSQLDKQTPTSFTDSCLSLVQPLESGRIQCLAANLQSI